jgi:glucosylceramidase
MLYTIVRTHQNPPISVCHEFSLCCRFNDFHYTFRFLDAYRSRGLNFWALTPQNEPCNGRLYTIEITSMGWSPEDQREWVTNYLGPALHAKGYKDLEILIFEDQLPLLPLWFDVVS